MNDYKIIYGGNEISKLDPQIKTAFKLITKQSFAAFRSLNDSKIQNNICKLGFEYRHSTGHTFIGERQVIKVALFTRRPPPAKYRVPTLIYNNYNISPSQWYMDVVIAIQPKVDLSVGCEDFEKWSSFFEKKLSNVDAHEGNYGIYNGKVLLFDW